MGKNYAISAGNPVTLEAAELILDSGGNAVDAAIAAYLACFVAEPCMASAGAGGFAMVGTASETYCIDFFCQTPVHKRPAAELDFYPVTIDFGTAQEDFHIGRGAAATPGAVAGIFAMHERWATMPMSELSQPALTAAKQGAKIDAFQAYDIDLLSEIFLTNEYGQQLFAPSGELLTDGDSILMPAFADFLHVLCAEGPDLFYKGEVAKSIVLDQAANGGSLQYEDFLNYEAKISHPLSVEWADHIVQTTPTPSVGGALIVAFLHEYLQVQQSLPTPLSRDHYDRLVRCYDRVNRIKDDDRLIAQYLYETFGISIPATNSAAKWNGTSHFNVVDDTGMAVGLTTSIGEGCGYFIPGTDMQLNNMLGEAALLPKGFHSWVPNTRLRSMMTPTIVRNSEGHIVTVTGSGGAGRIPFAIAQTIINHILHNLPIHEAVNMDRIHKHNGMINVEPRYQVEAAPHITKWDKQSLYFGGVHSIARSGTTLEAAGDLRRHGVSVSH